MAPVAVHSPPRRLRPQRRKVLPNPFTGNAVTAPAHDTTPSRRYSSVAILLHWLIALLVIFEVGLGLRMSGSQGPAQFAAFQLHKSVGVTILLLVALRLLWRLRRKPPAMAAQGWQRLLAQGVHLLFYVVLFALPLSGWALISSSRIAVPTLLFGVVPWPHLPGFAAMPPALREGWNDAAAFVHVNLVKVIYGLFALHVAGALKHQLLDRDDGLARMAPGLKAGSWTDRRLLLIGIGVLLAAALGWRWLPIVSPQAPASATAAPPAVAAQPAPPPAPLAAPAAPAAAEPALAPEPALSSSWTIAPGSTLRFGTTWSGQPIEGGFSKFSGDITFDPENLDLARARVTVRTDSVESGDAQRDDTLKSADWFSSSKDPTATFRADRFRRTREGRYTATGTLRIKGVTLPASVAFTLSIKGDEATMRGSATVDRTAYGIGQGDFASTTDIPASVKIDISLKAVRKKGG